MCDLRGFSDVRVEREAPFFQTLFKVFHYWASFEAITGLIFLMAKGIPQTLVLQMFSANINLTLLDLVLMWFMFWLFGVLPGG